jgi:hypothetical protein
MTGLLVTLGLLSAPAVHLVWGHQGLRRLVSGGTYFPTAHERRHALRSAPARAASSLAWLAYIAGAVTIGVSWG